MPDPTRELPPAGRPTADPSAGLTGDHTGGITVIPGATTPTPDGGRPEVPGYELLEEIGRGGMGVVYRAKDLAFGRDVAVKLLQDHFPPGGVAARRFADEARITGTLQHPGVPAAYQTGTLPDGRPFLAMKLIKGRTLADLIEASGGRQPPDGPRNQGADAPRSPDPGYPNLVAAFEGVCQAVGYAHAHGVVHRDLKPANVMVGSFGEVQVMDWGLAKVLAEGAAGPADAHATAPGTEVVSARDVGDQTQAGAVLGTAAYMPPEQAIGAVDEVDERSDVFGLGAVLCAVLTGKPPYTGDSAESSRKLAARARLDDAFGRLDGCKADPGLVALCKRCLSADKADRPADGGEVAKAVAALRADAEARARQAELDRVKADGERAKAEAEAREQHKRRRVQLALGSAVLLTLLAGGGLAGWQWRRAEGALAGVTAEQGKTTRALEAVTAEQGRTAEALEAVKAEQAKTAQALADKTAQEEKTRQALEAVRAESAAKDEARGQALAALRQMTNELAGDQLGRRVALTDRERQFLRNVLRLWEGFAASTGDGPAADLLRAEGASRVGLLRHRLGDGAGAEEAFRAAAAAYDRLAAAH
ncbi:MAG: protein kinase, partial [Gemmataceae bacterium]|nr:protein kinase [Gemmataceae bacterium]